MIKNSGLGLLAEVAADEDYYPVRRRGEKRRLNPNRAAIEWLENDTFDLTDAGYRYLMSDTGGRYAVNDDTLDDLILVLVLVTRAYGSTLGTHHNRPMFECFKITGNKGTASYPDPCPDCDNFAYSPRECERHALGVQEAIVDDFAIIREGIARLSEERHRLTYERQAELYATMTGTDGSEINASWRVDPS